MRVLCELYAPLSTFLLRGVCGFRRCPGAAPMRMSGSQPCRVLKFDMKPVFPNLPIFYFTMRFFEVSLATLFFAAFASAGSPVEKRDPGFIALDFEVVKETQTAFIN